MKLELNGDKLYVYRMTHIQIEAYGTGNIRYFVPQELLPFASKVTFPNFVIDFQGNKQKKDECCLLTEKSILSHSCIAIYNKTDMLRLGYDCSIKIRNKTDKEILYQPEACLGYYERA